jgi:hypothetical protein
MDAGHAHEGDRAMANRKIQINRAPVMTLWAAVAAERLGYEREMALTLAKAVAQLNAESKGRRLGIIHEETEQEKDEAREREERLDPDQVELLGRAMPTVETPQGRRAVLEVEPVDPASVDKYLSQKSQGDLDDVRTAMQKLAKSYPARELEGKACGVYEKLRPEIPEGAKGWGARGELDLDYIVSLGQ